MRVTAHMQVRVHFLAFLKFTPQTLNRKSHLRNGDVSDIALNQPGVSNQFFRTFKRVIPVRFRSPAIFVHFIFQTKKTKNKKKIQQISTEV